MVNIDSLLSEWAYRCEKGYPDMDSPSDLKILKDILNEQGITLPQFQEQIITEEEGEKELSKEDIKKLIDRAELTPSQLKRIQKVISQVTFMEAIDNYLEKVAAESNILPKELGKFKTYLEELGILEDFAQYIKNPVDFNLNNSHFADNIKEIPKDKLTQLYLKMGSTTDEKNVNIGPGEILFSILFKNTKKRENGGDLSIGSEGNVELKASTGASGAVIAKGYNRGKWSETKRKGQFEKFITDLGMEDEAESDALKYLEVSKSWPMKLSLIYDLYSEQDNFDKEKFKSGVISILSKIYNQSDWYLNGTFFNIDSYFTDQDMNPTKFRLDLAKELIKEYMDYYKFGGILYVDKKGNIDYHKGEQITNEIGKSIIITGPSDDIPRYRLKK
jgi:hypothetical protein